MFRFIYFPLFMIFLFVITSGILSTLACDAYVQLKTSGTAIKLRERLLTINIINVIR